MLLPSKSSNSSCKTSNYFAISVVSCNRHLYKHTWSTSYSYKPWPLSFHGILLFIAYWFSTEIQSYFTYTKSPIPPTLFTLFLLYSSSTNMSLTTFLPSHLSFSILSPILSFSYNSEEKVCLILFAINFILYVLNTLPLPTIGLFNPIPPLFLTSLITDSSVALSHHQNLTQIPNRIPKTQSSTISGIEDLTWLNRCPPAWLLKLQGYSTSVSPSLLVNLKS